MNTHNTDEKNPARSGSQSANAPRSKAAAAFLRSLDPESLRVGNGCDHLPLWVGVDAEAQKVYKIYANGLATGFGDGAMTSIVGVGARAGKSVEQNTIGRHIMLSHGEGIGRQMELIELQHQSSEVAG